MYNEGVIVYFSVRTGCSQVFCFYVTFCWILFFLLCYLIDLFEKLNISLIWLPSAAFVTTALVVQKI